MKKLLCVLLVFVIFSCNDARETASLSNNEAIAEVIAVNEPRQDQPPQRKLIQNGSISFEVADVSKTRHYILLLTNEANGYIASERIHKNDDRPRYEQVVRIPGNKLDEFNSKLEALATRIDNRNFTADDVTEEYVDLESRLIAKKELETRFREIVKHATKIDDILKVEDEIGIVRSEIETLQGKLKFMSNKVSYSTVTLTYYQPYETPVIEKPGVGSKFASAFLGGWNSIVSLAIGLTAIWPYLLIITLGIWLVIRQRRKRVIQA
ncbi:MAG TPA: DUF4349 domain-containing protein [Cyclobacteriaceae bacterium]|nr:DUF4349 domain-containing protein [Cyclobacteriaceae bacterium]